METIRYLARGLLARCLLQGNSAPSGFEATAMARDSNRLKAGGATRVSAASICASLDAIRSLLGMEFSIPLYRYISQKTGIHPTTLLRYHRGCLNTAPYTLSVFLVHLRQRIAQGYRPTLEGRLRRKAPATKPKVRSRRVSNGRVRRLLLDLIERLQVPPNMLYREVGTAVGLHPITVFRHADGQLATAPRQLFEYLSEMQLAVDSGREVVFTRAKLGTHVVPRDFVVCELHRLMRMGIFASKRSLLRFVEESLGMKPRSLERTYSPRKQILLPVEVLHFLRTLIARLEYVPEDRYEVGARIFHPAFGCGVVVGKEHKDKLAVEFADGARQVLRENLIELREWDRRESWWDEAGASAEQGSR